MASSVALGIGVLLTVLAILAFGLAFSTDYWASWSVNRVALRTFAKANPTSDVGKNIDAQYAYFSRYFGIWRTCYPGNETYQFLSKSKGVVDNYCIVMNYGLDEMTSSSSSSATSEYRSMIDVRRCQFAFLVVALACGLMACIAGTWGCWKASPSPNKVAGVLDLIAAIFGGGACGCFHGVHYMEQNLITDPGFYKSWPSQLKLNSLFKIQWSYILCWVGVGIMLLSAILFLVEGYNISQSKKRAKKQQQSQRMHDYMSEFDRKSVVGYGPHPTMPPPVPYQTMTLPSKPQPPPQMPHAGPNPGDDRLVPVLVYDNFAQDLEPPMTPSSYHKYM